MTISAAMSIYWTNYLFPCLFKVKAGTATIMFRF